MKQFLSLICLSSCHFIIGSPSAFADSIFGYLGGGGRYFLNEPLYTNQHKHDVSGVAKLEFYKDFNASDQRVVGTLFGRYDNSDSHRSHGDIRELYWSKNYANVELYAGIRQIFWGVMESVHLVDVINQTDLVEDIDGEDKLGQPMLQANIDRDWGSLSVFVLPYFRERNFPDEQGRLRPPLPISDKSFFESGAEKKHIDVAIRWSHYVDLWDIGISHFSGTKREPYFVPALDANSQPVLKPLYPQSEQTSVDVQATFTSWVWRAELIRVDDTEAGVYSAFAGGFEYTFYGLGPQKWDFGLISEYQYDSREKTFESRAQNDLAIGGRWALNDLAGTQILALITKDLDYSNQFISLEASRRLSTKWEANLTARLFNNVSSESYEYTVRDDDYIELEFLYYFQ
ncbi:hypothetical protein NBRC116494_00570 [Aurantivibrio plasticivorans]